MRRRVQFAAWCFLAATILLFVFVRSDAGDASSSTHAVAPPSPRSAPVAARVVLVTSASRRGHEEYGELKAAYVYGPSVDNKARYCRAQGWDLVVGSELDECSGRSARWNKIAWLRRLSNDYDWMVWMDLDCFFTRLDGDASEFLDPRFQAHFTPDSESTRVNTGVFALRGKSKWTEKFLRDVWEDNDAGEGQSDQNSINRILQGQRNKSVFKLHDKSLLNAFPSVDFIPTEDYEIPPEGDETNESLVVHFAGQYGGARPSDGATPATMLVQFLDLMLSRHYTYLMQSKELFFTSPSSDRFVGGGIRPVDEALALVRDARGGLGECLERIRRFYTQETYNDYGIRSLQPASDDKACDSANALRKSLSSMSKLLLDDDSRPTSLASPVI